MRTRILATALTLTLTSAALAEKPSADLQIKDIRLRLHNKYVGAEGLPRSELVNGMAEVILYNAGPAAIDGFKVSLGIDGFSGWSVKHGPIKPGASGAFKVSPLSGGPVVGNLTLIAKVSDIDGAHDPDKSNNSLKKTFLITKPGGR